MKLTMKQGILAAGCLLPAQCLTQSASAQQTVAAKAAVSVADSATVQAAKPTPREEAQTAAPSRPGEQGIKIHGHWVIDIRNPDGSLDRHLDFDNSLTTGGAGGTFSSPTGDQIIAALLSGSGSPSDPGIALVQGPSPGTSIPAGADLTNLCGGTSGYTCGILTTARSVTQYFASTATVQSGLRATVSFSPNVNWVMSGNFTVPSGLNSITAVQTLLPLCLSQNTYVGHYSGFTGSLAGSGSGLTQTTAPSVCTLASTGATIILQGPLTQTIVPGAPQAVTPGQVITVTVTITFS